MGEATQHMTTRPTGFCDRCRRPLKDPRSVERGLGPVCFHKGVPAQGSLLKTERPRRTSAPFSSGICGNPVTRQVWIDGEELSPAPSQAIRNHSPDGFNWGYGGSGPAQLALAILLKMTTPGAARILYQKFKWDFVARWSGYFWCPDPTEVEHWIELKRREIYNVL